MKTIRPYLILSIAMLIAALAITPSIAGNLDELPPNAPDDAIANFIQAMKATSVWKAADAMRRAALEPNMERWEAETGLTLALDEENFLDFAEGLEVTLGDTTYYVTYERVETGEEWIDIPVFVLHVEPYAETSDDEPQAWSVSPDRLRELDFDFVLEIVVQHPIHQVLPRHSAREMQLAEVLSVLTELAGCDHAINHSLAGEIRVTFDFRNRRISECLELAADVAGWTVQYLDYDLNAAAIVEDDEWGPFVGGEPRNGWVDTVDVAATWAARAHHNARQGSTPINTLQDAIEFMLRNAARRVKSQRAVVAMMPRS